MLPTINFQQWILSLPRATSFAGNQGLYGSWEAVASSSSCVSARRACPQRRGLIISQCEALSKSLGRDAVVFPQDNAYSRSLNSFFSVRTQEIHPSCIVRPTSAVEVSTAVKTLTLGATIWEGDKCQFAIRGAGHTPFGAANIENGIVVDLVHMPSEGLSDDLETITVSPSMTWDQVYETLEVHNRSTLGTKVAGPGVGGAATSCGVSYFSPRYGFICDIVENFEVVLATGEIVNANANEHPRLWKALRGGISNFGIVTALKLKTFEQGPFWGGQTFHTVDQRGHLFQGLKDLAHAHPYDPYSQYIASLVFLNISQSWMAASNLHYTKSDPPVENPEVFKAFTSLSQTPPAPGAPPNTLRVAPVSSYAAEYAQVLAYPKRWMYATISFAPDAEFMEEFFQMADKAMQPFKQLDRFQLAMNHQPMPTLQSERYGAVDSLGPIQTQGNVVFIHWALSVDRNEGKHYPDIQAAVQKLFKNTNKKAKEWGVYRSYIQPTYAEAWQNPFDMRSKGTLKDLRETSKIYDPNQVFQKQVPGGFKLPRA